jgi:hypothetical protein
MKTNINTSSIIQSQDKKAFRNKSYKLKAKQLKKANNVYEDGTVSSALNLKRLGKVKDPIEEGYENLVSDASNRKRAELQNLKSVDIISLEPEPEQEQHLGLLACIIIVMIAIFTTYIYFVEPEEGKNDDIQTLMRTVRHLHR